MKHHHIRFVYVFSALVLMSACSVNYPGVRFNDFSDASALLGKNIDYVIQQSRAEELNLRRAEALNKEEIEPADFQPRVLTIQHVEIRKELTKYLASYAQLLASLMNPGDREELRMRALTVYTNIQTIDANHKGFLSTGEKSVIATWAATIPEAMTAAKRRAMILKVMEQNQTRLEKITDLLTGEIQSLQLLVNNFYQRQFLLLVGDRWGVDRQSRAKLAQEAQDLIVRRDQLNVIFTDLAKALGYIPRTHKELRRTLKNNGSPLRATIELLELTNRIEAYFQEFSY